MAPPPNRRSGFSRRAQYSTFFSYLAGIVGALVGGVLLVVSIANPGAFSGLRGIAADAAEPAGRAAASGRDAGHSLFEGISGYFSAGRENARLQRELDAAKVRLVEASATAEENRRLKALLALATQDPPAVAVSTLTGSTATGTRRFATLGAGADRAVAVGMPIRSPLGLVGRVVEVGPSTARVMLVTDTESLVPVRRAGDGVPAFAQGRGDGTLQIRLISLGINPLKVGDVFVTSGSGGLYRPGIALARAARLTRDGAIAQVLSDPAASEYVMVERAWGPEPPSPRTPQPAAAQ